MSDTLSNNSRIAKNTIFLYFRMFITMAVSLYASRVVLNTLGVEDFGIYNVVGGVVGMFGFLNTAMARSTQRFLTFELGKTELSDVNHIFCTSINVHFVIAAVVLILAETIGLWFLCTQMVISDGRMTAAFWVYQCSIISTIVMIMSVPYNSLIIAHEKMSAFAYISIVDVVLKLLIVYLLVISSYDKLILYAILLLIVQIFITAIYIRYCKKYFEESEYHFSWNPTMFRNMFGFAGWILWGELAYVGFTQGLNILLNIFFGPAVNASRGIAVQVQSAVRQMAGNFQTALNPQITKSYAANDNDYLTRFLYVSSRMSYYLIFLISIPFLIDPELLLELWLKQVPDYCCSFTRIILLVTILDTMMGPLITAATANGKIKWYQITLGGLLLLIVPLSYIALKMGYDPNSVFIVHLFVCMITILFRLYFARKLNGINSLDFAKHVLWTCALSSIPVFYVCLFIHESYFKECSDFVRLSILLLYMLGTAVCFYLIGFTKSEKNFVLSKIKTLLHK